MKVYRLQNLSSVYGLLEVDSMKIIEAYGDNAFEDLKEVTTQLH